MPRSTRLLVAVALASLLAACAQDEKKDRGPDEYEGSYEVLDYVKTTSGCTKPAGDPYTPFFTIEPLAPGFPNGGLTTRDCSAAGTCEPHLNASWYFPTKAAGKWSGEATRYSAGKADNCSLGVTENWAELAKDGTLSMRRVKREALSIHIASDAECDLASSIYAKTELFTCTTVETLKASKLRGP